MTENERRLLFRAMDSGHICWQCPETEDPCPDCVASEAAWKILRRLVQPKPARPSRRTKKEKVK